MSLWKGFFIGVVVLTCLAAAPRAAHAQGVIAGSAKDGSGAVLPGVTVEAASDVLIEKTRVVVTDDGSGYFARVHSHRILIGTL